MLTTLSLCPTCYKKIPAEIHFTDGVVMVKECDNHGQFVSIVEKSIEHFSNFYECGTLGKNNTIIIHVHNQCNMKCPWCYYPMGVEKMHEFPYYDNLLRQYKGTFRILLSGGEPTIRPDYLAFNERACNAGWETGTITNMLKLADSDFFKKTSGSPLYVQGGTYKFAMSMQHPKYYSKPIATQKMRALANIRSAGLKAMCIMFSIRTLDELDWIREFYEETKECYSMIRIRTMFKNWDNSDDRSDLYLSDLHTAFMQKFWDLTPLISRGVEHSNSYCLYMETSDGMNVSLSAGPTVKNVDYHLTSRPVFMLAMDGRCYPVPLAQIINEGISKGWKDGYRIEGGGKCITS
jgi:MoaA/NifB/PqqE/SkfB family radical SAM enzyme